MKIHDVDVNVVKEAKSQIIAELLAAVQRPGVGQYYLDYISAALKRIDEVEWLILGEPAGIDLDHRFHWTRETLEGWVARTKKREAEREKANKV